MKFKKTKNKKTKLFVKFDEDDRKDYLLGFRKRKQQRKEKAKAEIEQKYRNEKAEVRKKKRQLIQQMLEGADVDQAESSDEEAASSSVKVADYKTCTVEVKDLELKKTPLNTKTKPQKSLLRRTSEKTLEVVEGGLKSLKGLQDPLKKSNRALKSSLWKTASRKAKTDVNSKKRKKKKKIQITEL